MTVASLEKIAVTPFHAKSSSRNKLFPELQRILSDLYSTGHVYEVLIDGSFLTKKQNPADIDLTIIVPSLFINSFNPDALNLLTIIANKAYSDSLDSYVCLDDDPKLLAYWHRQWGAGRDERLKGYAVIRVGENDVGLRLAGIAP